MLQLYKLPLLEILDISRNKIRKISGEVKNLTSLRVFSIMYNRIDELPPELAEMSKLQILKVAENPLRFKLKKVIEAREAEVAPLEMNENEKEIAVTAEIKRHLRETQPIVTPVEVEPGTESGESVLDTPKPLKRVPSSRFPVKPSMNGIDVVPDMAAKSPGNSKPPPIPTRSHYRIASGQNGSTIRRPSISPLAIESEQNRSNSESVLQASVVARSKRMGMMRKQKSDLEPVEEIRNNRVSHLRGVSHGSVLRSRSSNAASPGGGLASPVSPKDGRTQRNVYFRRLSSLPEQKQEADWRSPVVEGAKGILYALYQIHPQISGLISVIKGRDSKRTSLELTYYNASSHVDRLNDALEQADLLEEEDEDAVERCENTVQRDCASCIMAYSHVISQLQENAKRIVAGADARYVRTLMLLLYGSMIEIKNAVQNFDVKVRLQETPVRHKPVKGFQTIEEEFSPPTGVIRSSTPTKNRPGTAVRAGARLRSDTAFQNSIPKSSADYLPNQSHLQSQNGLMFQGPMYPYGASTMANPYSSNAFFPHHGGLANSAADYPLGSRSRSNSRSITAVTLTNSSMASSLTNTPRSGESFNLPVFQNPPRVNPMTGLSDAQEESNFESIFLALSRAYDSALQALPIARRQFSRCAEIADEERQPKENREVWRNLVWRCKACLEVSEQLHLRLVNMKVKDTSNNGRNDRSFWQLTKSFTQSFIDLVAEMKEAKSLRLLSQDIVVILRPVQKASREAVRLIDSSPWAYLTEAGSQPFAPPLITNGMMNGYFGNSAQVANAPYTNGFHQPHHYPMHQSNASPQVPPPTSVQVAMQGVSPSSVALPATPLSAALGPAAQATIPSTPASAYGDSFFRGDVFARADAVLGMQQQNANLTFNSRR
jgi:RAM signalling pathway protein